MNKAVPSVHNIAAAALIICALVQPFSAYAEAKDAAPSAQKSEAAIEPAKAASSKEAKQIPEAVAESSEKLPNSKESLEAEKEAKLLKGSVTHSGKQSPLLYGSIQSLPKGTTIDLVSLVNVNSELSQKGDEIWVRVGRDIRGADAVAVPGSWYMHGLVTEAKKSTVGGMDGYVTVTFDKLVSPDRQTEVPFDAHITSKNSLPKAIAKHVLIDSGHVTLGALGGSVMAVQFGGMGTAIATHGISVGVGAGIGATIGLIGAAKRQGSISNIYPGDELKLVTTEPVSLPGFNAALIPSAKPIAKLKNFEVLINKVGFSKDPWGDNKSKLLTVDLTVNNKTANEYRFSSLAVVSDREQMYYPSPINGIGALAKKRVKPNGSENGVIAFSVDGKRHKYWLVLLDRGNQQELNRVPIN